MVQRAPVHLGLPSPGDFVSISQVLLPTVTPSPAVHNINFFETQPGLPIIEGGATVTMLKLQLASAESLARERLEQMQRLEAQVEAMKERRAREEKELAEQVSFLEEKLRDNSDIVLKTKVLETFQMLIKRMQSLLNK